MVCMYVPNWILGTSKIVLYITIVSIITLITVLFGMRETIKNNWEKYRCNPLIIPFAGLFGYNASDTFAECLAVSSKKTSQEVVTPYGDLFSIMESTAGDMSKSLGDMKSAISNVTTGMMNNISAMLTKFGNMGATTQFLLLKVQAIFQKILALYVTLLYFAWSMLKGLEAIVRDPFIEGTAASFEKAASIMSKPPNFGQVGKAIGKAGKAVGKSAKKTGKKIKKGFCFHKNTKVLMNDNTFKYISNIEIDDKLYGNNSVVGVMKFNGNNAELVNNSGILTTPYHHILYNGKYIRSANVPNAKFVTNDDKFLYDIDTSNHKIVCINNQNKLVIYTDFSEIEDDNDILENYELNVLNNINLNI